MAGTFEERDQARGAPQTFEARDQARAPASKRGVWDNIVGAEQTLVRSIPGADEVNDFGNAVVRTAADLATGKRRATPRMGKTVFDDPAFRENLAAQRAKSKGQAEGFAAAHPKAADLTKGAGMATSLVPAFFTGGATLAPAAAGAPAAGGLLGALSSRLAPLLKSGTVGGLMGGLTGLADEGTLPQRLGEANAAIPSSVALGAALPLAAGASMRGINAAARLFQPAEQKVAATAGRVLAARAPEAAAPAPVAANEGVLPFERMGRGGQSLARAVANVPGPGQEIAERALGARRAAAPERMLSATQRALGDDGAGFHTSMRGLDETRKAQAGPLYEEAAATPVYLRDFEEKLAPLLNTDIGRKAYASAQRLAQVDEALTGTPSGWTNAVIDEDGAIRYGQAPSAKTLDYIARGWDEALSPYRNPFGKLEGLSDEGRAMVRMRGEFVKRLGDLVPANAAARAAYAGPSQQMGALRRGRDIVTGREDPEVIAEGMGRMSADQLDAQRLGIARGLSDQFRSGNPQAAFRRLDADPVYQDRLRAGFGDDATFDAFLPAAKAEAEMQRSYNRVLAGSRTTPLAQDVEAANRAAGGGGAAQALGEAVARRAGGETWTRQAVVAAIRNWERVRQPGLNNPEVSRLLGEALFQSGDPQALLRAMVQQQLITPQEVRGVLPFLAAGAGEGVASSRSAARP